MKYPEHEKLSSISNETQFLGDFIEWLSESNKLIAYYDDRDRLIPVRQSINSLLAEYKNIDLQKLENEKLAMLSELQNQPHEQPK